MEENKKETKPVEEKKAEEKKVEAKQTPKKEEKKETKTNTKKEETKKNNHNMVIIGVAVAVVVVIAMIAGIMLLGNNSPKAVIEKELNNLKTGNFTQEMLSGMLQGENIDAEMVKLLYEKLEFKILEEKQEGEEATVEIEITNKDFKTIMGNLIQRAFKSALTGEVSEETMTNWLLEELRNEEIKTITTNASVTLKKENGNWKIVEEENFYYATLPGLQEAIDALN